mmetsp:Transcript_13362/g.43545  ORF Transcript_13362/g.43545 Transcript_13362/m.43545 type:complete len:191 (+) Transcript_13362:136-708(+)
MFLCLATTTLTALTAVKPRGTVAPGAVVVAPTQEYNHFLRKATVFVLDDGDDGTIGVNLGSPTMLTIGEAAANVVTGDLGDNKLWMGGEHGGTGAVMLHAVPGLAGSKKNRRLGHLRRRHRTSPAARRRRPEAARRLQVLLQRRQVAKRPPPGHGRRGALARLRQRPNERRPRPGPRPRRPGPLVLLQKA